MKEDRNPRTLLLRTTLNGNIKVLTWRVVLIWQGLGKSLTRKGHVTPVSAGRAEPGRELVLTDDDVRRPRGQIHILVMVVQGRSARVIVPGAERYSYFLCGKNTCMYVRTKFYFELPKKSIFYLVCYKIKKHPTGYFHAWGGGIAVNPGICY